MSTETQSVSDTTTQNHVHGDPISTTLTKTYTCNHLKSFSYKKFEGKKHHVHYLTNLFNNLMRCPGVIRIGDCTYFCIPNAPGSKLKKKHGMNNGK